MTTYVNPGLDASGNGNNWTTNNINWTSSGSTFDTMTDVPTLTSATAANFATMNPLGVTNTSQTLTNGNLTHTSSTNWLMAYSTMSMQSGKFYAEFTATDVSNFNLGIIATSGSSVVNANTANSGYAGKYSDGYGWICNFGTVEKVNNNSYSSYGTTPSNGDIIMVAFDATAGSLYFGRNGTWFGSSDPATSTSPAFSSIPMTTDYYFASGLENANGAWNFGQRPFTYTPPTGYVALNTYNLPTPTIGATASSQANKYFDATLYTGTGSAQSITNAGSFAPDLVWLKSRSAAGNNRTYDIIRGATKVLYPNATNGEGTEVNGLTSFNSNGFSIGTDAGVNANGTTFVAWQWDAGGTGVTNTAGSITSTVSANTTSGFSVVTWTGTGSNATIGHGLGVAPKFIIVKRRDSAANWPVQGGGWGPQEVVVYYLNSTNGYNYPVPTIWNDTAPTSSVFSVGSSAEVNASGGTYVAYIWTDIAGYSKSGSYQGNGSTDGPFIYTGFKPKYLLLKSRDALGGWVILDSSRSTYNVVGKELYANASSAEGSGYTDADFLSNGFKLRVASDPNASSTYYIYMAFAENPFKYANAR